MENFQEFNKLWFVLTHSCRKFSELGSDIVAKRKKNSTKFRMIQRICTMFSDTAPTISSAFRKINPYLSVFCSWLLLLRKIFRILWYGNVCWRLWSIALYALSVQQPTNYRLCLWVSQSGRCESVIYVENFFVTCMNYYHYYYYYFVYNIRINFQLQQRGKEIMIKREREIATVQVINNTMGVCVYQIFIHLYCILLYMNLCCV